MRLQYILGFMVMKLINIIGIVHHSFRLIIGQHPIKVEGNP